MYWICTMCVVFTTSIEIVASDVCQYSKDAPSKHPSREYTIYKTQGNSDTKSRILQRYSFLVKQSFRATPLKLYLDFIKSIFSPKNSNIINFPF